jgi:hypothetical protein
MTLKDESFVGVLPLLRRLFTTFTDPERKEIGKLIKSKDEFSPNSNEQAVTAELDKARANAVLPIIAQLLGIEDTS